MKARKMVVSLVFVFIAFLVMLHQYIFWGTWFDLKDIHHETFVVALAFGALLLAIANWRKT